MRDSRVHFPSGSRRAGSDYWRVSVTGIVVEPEPFTVEPLLLTPDICSPCVSVPEMTVPLNAPENVVSSVTDRLTGDVATVSLRKPRFPAVPVSGPPLAKGVVPGSGEQSGDTVRLISVTVPVVLADPEVLPSALASTEIVNVPAMARVDVHTPVTLPPDGLAPVDDVVTAS